MLLPRLCLALTLRRWLTHAVTSIDPYRRADACERCRRALSYGCAGTRWLASIGAIRSASRSTVSLVQGNVEQDVKFEPTYREKTLRDLRRPRRAEPRQARSSCRKARCRCSPTKFRLNTSQSSDAAAQRNGGDLLLGLFFFEPRDERRGRGALLQQRGERRHRDRLRFIASITLCRSARRFRSNRSFGWFIRSVLAIPLADQTPGPAYQEPFAVAGQRLAVNICYEDAFGGELARRAADATLLVNVTNDAWYGHSLAAEQHEQIAAMRALETARPMLRATNTGITSIIDHHGVERSRLPWFTRGVLEGTVAGRHRRRRRTFVSATRSRSCWRYRSSRRRSC